MSGISMDDAIIFLCPNGHKLSGPANLKGKPGQCPHCNAKFVIPEDEVPGGSESAAAGQSVNPDATTGQQSSADNLGAVGEMNPFPPVPSLDSAPSFPDPGGVPVEKPAQSPVQNDGMPLGPHPAKNVFEQLLTNPARRIAMSRAAMERVRNEFDATLIVQQWEDLFEQVASEHQPRNRRTSLAKGQ